MINRQKDQKDIADQLIKDLRMICDRYITNCSLFHDSYKTAAKRLKSVVNHLEADFKYYGNIGSYYETTLCLVQALQKTLIKGSVNFQSYLDENILNKYPELKEEITNVSRNYTNEIDDVVGWLQVKNYESVRYDATGITPFREKYEILQRNKNPLDADRQNVLNVDENKGPGFLQQFKNN